MIRTSIRARPATLPEVSEAISSRVGQADFNGSGLVDPDDLSRFEGEGGREAPELVEVRVDNAIWRRPRWAAGPDIEPVALEWSQNFWMKL